MLVCVCVQVEDLSDAAFIQHHQPYEDGERARWTWMALAPAKRRGSRSPPPYYTRATVPFTLLRLLLTTADRVPSGPTSLWTGGRRRCCAAPTLPPPSPRPRTPATAPPSTTTATCRRP